VVTFNQPQRELIETLIVKECEQDEAFAARYQQELQRRESNQDVGFFVKNLESVQGDERDVMIFSTTFGKNKENRFFRRFGPVGARGGERRLNVAITRAKCQVYIVGSMPLHEISTVLQSSDKIGAQVTPSGYLQLYLAYAKAVSDSNDELAQQLLNRVCTQGSGPVRTEGDKTESPLEEEVRDAVLRFGYQLECQVGDSGFRIDLAVVHPDPLKGYVLGIECDGAAYHSSRSARNRDVWRQAILEDRGWRFYRIWSTLWWSKRAQELERLKRAIEDSIRSTR